MNVAGILLPRGVNIRHQHLVRSGEGRQIVAKQGLGAGIGVGLADHEELAVGKGGGQGNHRAVLLGVVAIIVV